MKKRIIALLLSLALCVACVALPAAAADAQTTIRIVHTNDIHGYYTATSRGQIGFSALSALIAAQRAELVLDIGDTLHGQAFATVEQGMSIARLLDAAGYDAMTPGNHDWSYGAARLRELDEQSDFAILASNVKTLEGEDFFATPYLVKQVTADDGTQLKIGVLGVIDDAFYSSTAADNLSGLTFTEEAAQANKTAQLLREREQCDIVLALTHQSDPRGFVSALSGVDAVLAGHEHILIDERYPDADGRQVPVVEAGYYFTTVGVLSLTYDAENGQVSAASEQFFTAADTADYSDDTVAALITEIERGEQTTLSEVVGVSRGAYPYSWEDVRTGEQPIGRIVTAAYRHRTGADIAIENAGGIRGGIDEGDVTYYNLISISPYGNVLMLKQLTGSQILDIVEHSLEINRACDEVYSLQKLAVEQGRDPYEYSWPDNSGSALQFGGIQIEYDMTRPLGSRVVSASIGGGPLQLEQLYTVATNNYVAQSDEYPALAAAPLVSEYGTCEQALRGFFAAGDFEAAAAIAGLVAYTAPSEDETTTAAATTAQTVDDTPDTGATTVAWVLLPAAALLAVLFRRRRFENE